MLFTGAIFVGVNFFIVEVSIFPLVDGISVPMFGSLLVDFDAVVVPLYSATIFNVAVFVFAVVTFESVVLVLGSVVNLLASVAIVFVLFIYMLE